MQCGVCGNGIILKFQGIAITQWFQSNISLPQNVLLLGTWPKRNSAKEPDSIPASVGSYYLQARGSEELGHWDAAGAMFRKALDVSLRTLNPNAKGTIFARIESLPEEAGVTSAMKEWAHAIRRLGADAAHDEDPFTDEEAKSLGIFTEMFLTYAFSLPALLRKNQKPTSNVAEP
jgi:hypothetical protein